MGHYVYKYVYDGEIVYIGKNDTNLASRINQHKRERKFLPYLSSDIHYIKLENKTETKLMESLLINKYKPLLNVSEKHVGTGCSIYFEEPEWLVYCEDDFIEKKDKNKIACSKKLSSKQVEKRKKELELMFSYLHYYQYIYDADIKSDGEISYIEIPREGFYENTAPMYFTITTKTPWGSRFRKYWCSYGIFTSATCHEEYEFARYKINEEHYKIFCDNFDLVISQYKEKIVEFANKNGLEFSFDQTLLLTEGK